MEFVIAKSLIQHNSKTLDSGTRPKKGDHYVAFLNHLLHFQDSWYCHKGSTGGFLTDSPLCKAAKQQSVKQL